MNLRTMWAGAMAFVALMGACSKESDAPAVSQELTARTKEVNVVLTAGREELRAVYGLRPDGAIAPLEMPEKDVLVRVSVRRGEGKPIVQDLVFTKQAGLNYATYNGKITVPADGSGDYKIAAALVGEVGSSTPFLKKEAGEVGTFSTPRVPELPIHTRLLKEEVHRFTSPAGDGKLDINVPYVTRWQDITLSGTDAASKTTLYFEPQGTVLRVRIKNETSSQQTFRSVKFVTNAFTITGGYFMDENMDNYPGYYPSNYTQMNFPLLGNAVTLEPNATSAWYYVWVSPRKSTTAALETAASLNVGGVYQRVFQTSQALPWGSVPLTLPYHEGHDAEFENLPENDYEWGSETAKPASALSYFASHVLAQDKASFVSDYTTANPNVARLSSNEIFNFGTVTIGGQKYGVPTRDELAALFPEVLDETSHGVDKFKLNAYVYDVVEANIKIGAVTQDYKNDYVRLSSGDYAIRFKSTSNRYRTAFRYRVVTEAWGKGLKIETIYIGNEPLALTDIANPSFWTTRAANVESLVIPYYGWTVPLENSGLLDLDKIFAIPTSTRLDRVAMFFAQSNTIGGYIGLGSVARSWTPLLIKR